MNKRSTRFYRKNEAEVMERLGFSPTVNSGAGWIQKEDGESEDFVCQLKSTDKESMSIKQKDLLTLEIHALESHKLPVFAFQFLNRDEVWVAVRESDIEAVKAAIKGEKKKEQVDEPEETEYNSDAGNEYAKRSVDSLLARKKYMRQKQREAEQRRAEIKETIKENRRKRAELWKRK